MSIVSITDEMVALGPYGAPCAGDALVQQNEDAVERERRPHAHLDEHRATAGEWVPDELEAEMYVFGAGLAFGARLRTGRAASRDGLYGRVRLARGVPSLAIRS